MKYSVNSSVSDVPDELVRKVKRLILSDLKEGKITPKPVKVELKFNVRLDHCKVIDVATFQTIGRYDLNYKEPNEETEKV